ncbi:MAG: hypothetical protein HC813_02185, partial [Planctomycetes bacterium]|nr:hypothetical protein [Planctomycetota bacterium]
MKAWGPCAFHLLGGDGTYEIAGLPAGVSVERGERSFRVRAAEPGLHEFAGEVRMGEERFPFSGLTIQAQWKVRWWRWSEDPREAREGSGGGVIAAPPLAERHCDALDFAGGTAPRTP